MNNNDAKRFLTALGGRGAYWHFQMFDDAKLGNKALAKQMYGHYDELLNKMLVALNESGAGIFAAVNEHERDKNRAKKTTTKIRAIFADFDDIDTAQQQVNDISAVLEPSIVVESSPGKFHVYYVLSDQGAIPVEEFTHWQKRLVKDFKSDPKCTDSSRVMRVPGFMHNKKDPQPVRLIKCTDTKYDLDDLVAAFYGGRNNYLTSVAGRLRHEGHPVPEIQDKVGVINSRLKVPLDEDEVELISGNMNNYAPDPVRAEAYNLNQLAQSLNLQLSKEGRLLPSGVNLRKLVAHDVEAKSLVRKNIFTNRPEIVEPVQWQRDGLSINWTDADTIAYRSWLISRYGDTEFSRSDVWDLVIELMLSNTYDPLMDYLNALEWDGVERAETVFIRHLGATDDAYSRMCARNFLLGSVNRGLNPGCRHDEMVVFFGMEGIGKSAISRHLCPDESWFNSSLSADLSNKDAMAGLHGKWIVEMAELRSIMGSSSEHVKAFLTSTTDSYRPPYEKLPNDFKRRCTFIGTTNNHYFLTDNGQNRRFLPLEVHKEMNEDAIKAERDQIWAEAVQWHKRGDLARPPREMWDTINKVRLESTDDGEFASDIIRYIEGDDLADPINVFIPRDFYLATVENASRDKWVRESRIHRQISNAAKIVFSQMDDWEFTKFRHDRSVVRGWRRK